MFKVITLKDFIGEKDLEDYLNINYKGWIICGMNKKFLILSQPVWYYSSGDNSRTFQFTPPTLDIKGVS